MPELPEVETIRRSLESALPASRVLRVQILRRDVVTTPGTPHNGTALSRARLEMVPLEYALLERAEIARLSRLGKRLAIVARDGRAIEVQLGMSGQLLLQRNQPTPTHAHVVWTLNDETRLIFRDPRRFGQVRVHPSHDHVIESWSSLGPDALTIQSDDLRRRADASRRAIKSVLLDQRVLAGVGNIYADEALFEARLHPASRACDLDGRQWAHLARSIRAVLTRAIDRKGSTLRDYRDANGSAGSAQLSHKVYARGGLPCLRCSATLTSQTLAQRTTTWCPTCQILPPQADP